MKKSSRFLGIFVAAAFLVGCASIHQSGFPDTTSNKGKKVTASLSHFNILYLVPPENLDKLMDDLSEQCGNAKVEGIAWTDSRRWFYIFGQLVTISVSGRCAE